MSHLNLQRVNGTYAPTATGATNIARLAPPREVLGMTQNAKRIIDFTCFVVTAGNGTGTVSFGRTSGTATSLMTTANVGSGVTGRKTTAGGTDFAQALGTSVAPGAAEEFLTATYTIGTDTVTPIIRWTAVIVNETDIDKLRVQRS